MKELKNDSVEFVKIFSKIYLDRIIILKYLLVSFILGVSVALLSPNKYSSTTTFIPQLSSSSSNPTSSLSGLASLAGINLSEMVSDGMDISPLLYPKIVESLPFKLDLLSSKIIVNQTEITVRDFLDTQLSFNLINWIREIPSIVLQLFKKNNSDTEFSNIDIYKVTKQDKELFKFLDKLLSININDKDGFINISVTSKIKSVPAQITKNAQIILQNKIIDYKSKSSKDLLDFSTDQYDLKRLEYNSLQDEIAIFKDKNININSSLFQNKLDRLESEAQILQSVVQQLASQVEQAKLQVNKDTPVFTVINPVSIPYEKSKPQRLFIVLAFLSISLVISIARILFLEHIIEHIITIKKIK